MVEYRYGVMPIYNKGKVKHEGWGVRPATYFCRKDFRHEQSGHWWAFYRKKKIRRVANGYVRRFKEDIPKGGWYKKIFNVQYTVW